MRKHQLYWITLASSLSAILTLAACASLPASPVLRADELRQGTVTVLGADGSRAGTAILERSGGQGGSFKSGVFIASAQVDEQSVRPESDDVISEATAATTALGQQVALFTLEPLVAPCCPLPTLDQAVAAAQNTPGVAAVELLDDATLRVQFDSTQTDSAAIASAINRASFLVTVTEESAEPWRNPVLAEKGERN